MALVEVQEVKKTYSLGKTQVHALRGVSFSVEKGDFLSVVGPSGSGKTTLLNLIGCIDRPTEGRILFDGTDVSVYGDNEEADVRLKRMGFVFQTFNLVPVLSVVENVEFPMILRGVKKSKRRRRAADLVDAVGLSEYADHKPDELSGGQRQRVAIARALVNHPELVIADEPTANLDSETGGMIVDLMRTLNREQQVSFLFSTHNPDVTRYAQRIVRLRDGAVEKVEVQS
jgi:putative ABC transport system ATP-binding protein